jgi:hypothetical protein
MEWYGLGRWSVLINMVDLRETGWSGMDWDGGVFSLTWWILERQDGVFSLTWWILERQDGVI